MSDMSTLMGRTAGGFSADPRYLAASENEGEVSGMMALLGGRRATDNRPPPAADPIELARAEAYEQGLAYARAEAQAEAQAAEEARAKFALGFDRLNADLCEQLAQRLTETVVALCEGALAPLALDRKALAGRVKRAVAMFARADDERVIRMNLEDIKRVAPLLPPEWKFHPDPALAPGELRVETASGGVEDGPSLWARAIREAINPAADK